MDIALLKGAPVWRVGRFPDPWDWADHQYSGRNRWDDADGNFRTVYASATLFGCFVELLAFARPDPTELEDHFPEIDEDPEDAEEFPTAPAGHIPHDWLSVRLQAQGELSGEYVDVRTASTIAELRPHFIGLAVQLEVPDFDAAALKSAYPRELTQRVATRLYGLTDSDGRNFIDGVQFASRHGDDLEMWAVFERPEDQHSSRLIRNRSSSPIDPKEPALLDALRLHGLSTDLGS